MEITEKTKAISDFLNRNCLLSSTLRNFHFASPPLPSVMVKPHIGKTVLDNIRNLQVSLVSVSDEFYKTLNDIALENPLLQTLLSLSKRFNSVTQEIRCNHSRSQNSLSVHNFAAILPGDSVAGLVVANGISNFLNIYNTLLVVRLVLTWFPNSPPAIVSPLSTLCDPYLNIFRGIIPPLGGTLDLSPILAFLVLNAFTSTAAALPAELPVNDISSQVFSSTCPHLTATQKKWMRRVCNSSKKSEEAH